MTGNPDDRGVNFRAISRLFAVASDNTEIDYIFRISILEVYNEKLNDLLVEKQENIDKLKRIVNPNLILWINKNLWNSEAIINRKNTIPCNI